MSPNSDGENEPFLIKPTIDGVYDYFDWFVFAVNPGRRDVSRLYTIIYF